MNFKKIGIKREEVLLKRTTDYIELDFDFTQVYDCMYSLSFSLRSPTSFQLLFYILKTASKDNIIGINKQLYKSFIKEMLSHTNNQVSEQTFYSCIKELTDAKIITKLSRGQYFLNPYVLWRDDKDKRVEFVSSEELSRNGLTYNPVEKISTVKEDEVVYNILPKGLNNATE